MVIGGFLFAGGALRSKSLPTATVWLFSGGLLVNLVLALASAPEIMQTIGTTMRNAGLVGMGYVILLGRRETAL